MARRALRGLLCASTCLLVGAVSHIAAGGQLPGAQWLVTAFLALASLATATFERRKRRFEGVALTLGGMQFALHLAFQYASVSSPGHTTPEGRMSGHHMEMMDPSSMWAGGIGHEAQHTMTAGMTLAHGLATVGTALCVIYGERVVRRLAAMVVPAICVRPRLSLPILSRPRVMGPSPVTPSRVGILLARSRPRRGPPERAPA